MASTDYKDYYAILGVSKTATAEEIRKAFRKLARQYHPDLNPGNKQAEDRFKEINEAYEVLSDPDKKQKYDQFGQYWKQASQTGWNPNTRGVDFSGFDFGQFSNFEVFINELLGRGTKSTYGSARSSGGFGDFGGFNTQTQQTSNLDREATLPLKFMEAFQGVNKRINLGTETVEIRIPPGTKSKSRLRVRGKGDSSPYGSQRGDLYLVIELESHAFFQFEGDNLVCEVPITPDEAVLGASIEVPTPEGMVTVKVPPGIRSGQSLRLREKGWPNSQGKRGDQLVRIVIEPPKNLSDTERMYYEKLRDSRTYNPRENLKGY